MEYSISHGRLVLKKNPPHSSEFLYLQLQKGKSTLSFKAKESFNPQLLQIQHLLSHESADMARRNQNATKGTLQRKKKHSCSSSSSSSSFSAPPPFFVANGL
jgi:hypothetical protein